MTPRDDIQDTAATLLRYCKLEVSRLLTAYRGKLGDTSHNVKKHIIAWSTVQVCLDLEPPQLSDACSAVGPIQHSVPDVAPRALATYQCLLHLNDLNLATTDLARSQHIYDTCAGRVRELALKHAL